MKAGLSPLAGVKLGQVESYAVRYTVFISHPVNQVLAYAAALGLRWAGLRKPAARYQHDALRYGELVLNELVARGYTVPEITAAGAIAFVGLTADLVTEEELAEAEGNSDPVQTETRPGTGSSSASNESGASDRAAGSA